MLIIALQLDIRISLHYWGYEHEISVLFKGISFNELEMNEIVNTWNPKNDYWQFVSTCCPSNDSGQGPVLKSAGIAKENGLVFVLDDMYSPGISSCKFLILEKSILSLVYYLN